MKLKKAWCTRNAGHKHLLRHLISGSLIVAGASGDCDYEGAYGSGDNRLVSCGRLELVVALPVSVDDCQELGCLLGLNVVSYNRGANGCGLYSCPDGLTTNSGRAWDQNLIYSLPYGFGTTYTGIMLTIRSL